MKVEQAVKSLAALAHDSRLEVFRQLARCGPDGLAAGRLAAQLRIAPATLSFHLKELAHAGLIHQRRDGRTLYYSLNIPGIRSLMGYLMEDCCQGRPDLCQVDSPGVHLDNGSDRSG